MWHLFAANYHLFRGTPSRMWLDHAFETLFGFDVPLSAATSDAYYDRIADALATPAFRPRALYNRFNIEVISTTHGALDDLHWHRQIRDSGWTGRVVPAYRPDAVVDPDFPGFARSATRFWPYSSRMALLVWPISMAVRDHSTTGKSRSLRSMT